MRVRRHPLAVDLLAEIEKLLLAQAPFEIGARVDAGRAVTLVINEVSAMGVSRSMPKVHEAGIVQRRRGLEARDMPAKFRRGLVRAQHDRGGVPTDQRTDLVLDRAVTWMRRLVIGRDGIDVRGVGGKRQSWRPCAAPPERFRLSNSSTRAMPSKASTESNASSHSRVSAGSRSWSTVSPPRI